MAEEQKPSKSELLNVFCEMLRSITRPAVTVIFAATIAQVVVDRTDPPEWFLALAIPCITWWFAERTFTHIKEKKGG